MVVATQPLDEVALAKAVTVLCQRYPEFQSVVTKHGVPALRASPGGLSGLLKMVTEQFLSLAAAAAIWQRLELRLMPLTAEAVLECPHADLMALGLSGAKARSFHGLATAVASGAFDFATLEQMDDHAAHQALVALPGVGPWTADIYLLSVLLRADAWPWGDVALQAAAQDMFQLTERPDKAEMMRLGEGFKPYRAVAARLLWAHYRGMKRLSQA